jgi:hypothetical protein
MERRWRYDHLANWCSMARPTRWLFCRNQGSPGVLGGRDTAAEVRSVARLAYQSHLTPRGTPWQGLSGRNCWHSLRPAFWPVLLITDLDAYNPVGGNARDNGANTALCTRQFRERRFTSSTLCRNHAAVQRFSMKPTLPIGAKSFTSRWCDCGPVGCRKHARTE